MTGFSRTYTFLGTGMIWDPKEHRVLCKFDRSGKFVTSDPEIVQKLLDAGVPYEDAQSNILARTEHAVEILQERVKLLEQINEEQRIKLEMLERERAIETIMTREQIEAELRFLGAPYPKIANNDILQYILREYKREMREKVEREEYLNKHGV